MDFLNTLDGVLTSLIYLVASLVLFLIGRFVFKLVNKNIQMNHELVEKDNLAFAFTNVGYFVGLLIAIWSLYVGEDLGHILDNLLDIFILGLLSILLLNVSAFLTDKVVLPQFSMRKEIVDDQNVGAGLIEAAVYIANGLVIHGVLIENPDGYLEILLLWVVAQVAFLLVSKVYNLITPFNAHDEIEKDNVAVGVAYAGAILAVANLIRMGVEQEAENWIQVAENLGLGTGIGLLMLPLARLLADKVLLPGRNLTDELVNQEKPNVGAGVIEAFGYVGGSILICLSFA
ncbi:MAG: DUF350 domain-containing protein [Salibacteraceae bacterium]